MKRGGLISIILLIFFITAFAVYNYLISIYEVIYQVNPDKLYADGRSEIKITAIPLNGIGSKALFRAAEAEYTIIEGGYLVDILKYDKTTGILILKAKNSTGSVKITAKSSYALLPSLINIKIYPNTVEVLHEVNGII
jgi:hypothetical protein